MKYREYKELYGKLTSPEQIDRLARETGLDRELLLVIYTQRVTRDATKRFYKVKRKSKKMLYMWDHGTTLVQLSQKYRFPATLIAMMVLMEKNIPRRQFWRYLTDPSTAPDKRLQKELAEVSRYDIVYSPQGTEVQNKRGKWGERMLNEWLDAQGVEYRTEAELRADFSKTPDALLKTPIVYNGSKKFWIESKATFGDPYEIRKHIKRQLRPYLEMFGEGIVVYWFGYVNDAKLDLPEGVDILDSTFFK